MAGGIAKTFGVIFLIFGILLLLVGIGAAGYAYLDEQDNQDQLLADPDRSDQNEAVMMYGAAGAGAGLLLLIVGIISLVAGGARSQGAFRHDIQDSRAHSAPLPPTATELASARPNAASADADSPTSYGANASPRRNTAVVLVVIGVAVVLGLAALIALAKDGSLGGGGGGLLGGQPNNGPLMDESYPGSVRNAASLGPVGSFTQPGSSGQGEFSLPEDTRRLEVTLAWNVTAGGTDNLRIVLFEGETEIARAGGTSPVILSMDIIGTHTLRYEVYPNAEASGVSEQAFTVQVVAWR